MSVCFFDICENPLYISREYLQHRDRILTYRTIQTFRVKNRRLLINHYNRNEDGPTMCILFTTKEDAQAAFHELREMMFGEENEKKEELEVRCFSRSLKWLNGWF